MKTSFKALALAFSLLASSFSMVQANGFDINKPLSSADFEESLKTLSDYLKVDTTNPPGNEKMGALYLQKVLEKDGLEAKVFDTTEGRSCVYARWKGTGKKKPLILLNHIDVVPAEAKDWKYPPFGGEIHETASGEKEIWGRGALDMKGMGVMELYALLAMKRAGLKLDRDIIFLATPDEEVGGNFGAAWFAKNQKDLVADAEFLINEGFCIDAATGGKPKYWGVDVAEKNLLWLGLKTKGLAGHASMPQEDSANNRLIKALSRLVENPPPLTLLPGVQEFYEKIAATESDEVKGLYKQIVQSVEKSKTDKATLELLKKDKLKSAMLANTVSITVLKAGYKTNVIPAECSAELDCRLLPGVKPEDFVKEVKDILKDESVEVKILDWEKAEPSPFGSDFVKAVMTAHKMEAKDKKSQAEIPVVPVIVPWFTDSHWFRDLGIKAYGFEPVEIDPEHMATMHGKDERIPVEGFRKGTERLIRIIYLLSGPGQ